MANYQDQDRYPRQMRDQDRDRQRDDRMQTGSSRFEESRHWREDDRRNPYDQARNESYRGSARAEWDRPQHARGGGYAGAQFGDWESSTQGGAVGSELYGGYDRHGAGRNMSQSDYGGQSDYGYGGRTSQNYGGGYERNQGFERGGYHGYGRQSDDQGEGYAPGSQIWNERERGYAGSQTRRSHDHDPDYTHWREQQMRGFDDDYAAWRDERRQKFSSDFDTWRQNRPRNHGKGPQIEAENPVVGSVTDGDTGDMSKKKN